MVQRQGGGNDGDGWRDGDSHRATALRNDSNRRCYGDATAMTSMDGRNSDCDGWRNSNSNGWRNGDGDKEATKLMDGAMATTTAMDGGMAIQWQQKAQCQRNGDNVDGLHGGNGNGWRNGHGNRRRCNEVVAMTVLDGATTTAIA